MQLTSTSFADGQPIPAEFAFCAIDAKTHTTLSLNRNPHFAWSDAPAGSKSFARICHDSDVPSKGVDVNQEGRSVPTALPRVDFFHWVLIDIPASVSNIAAGEFSSSVTAHGKAGPIAPNGTRQGINDYTGWFANDNDMDGDYYGYDGPCPPWNDEIPHRYLFTLFALVVAKLAITGRFNGADARTAIAGQTLAEGKISGVYTLNPQVKL